MKEIYKIIHNFKVDKKFWTYDNLTGEDYDFKRSKAAPYLKKAIEIANQLQLKTVIEIGSTRLSVTQKCIDYFNEENNINNQDEIKNLPFILDEDEENAMNNNYIFLDYDEILFENNSIGHSNFFSF